MAGQPSGNGLVAHEFGVLMPAPGQGHDEEPGLADFAGVPVGDERTGAEIDLRHFADGEVEHDGGDRCGGDDALEEAMNDMHAAGKSMRARQSLTDGGGGDALLMPGEYVRAPRRDGRCVLCHRLRHP